MSFYSWINFIKSSFSLQHSATKSQKSTYDLKFLKVILQAKHFYSTNFHFFVHCVSHKDSIVQQQWFLHSILTNFLLEFPLHWMEFLHFSSIQYLIMIYVPYFSFSIYCSISSAYYYLFVSCGQITIILLKVRYLCTLQ